MAKKGGLATKLGPGESGSTPRQRHSDGALSPSPAVAFHSLHYEGTAGLLSGTPQALRTEKDTDWGHLVPILGSTKGLAYTELTQQKRNKTCPREGMPLLASPARF